MLDRNWGSGNLGEFIHAFCGITSGNHVIHGRLQWLRSTENPPQQSQLNRSVSISSWYNDEAYMDERAELCDLLKGYVIDSLGASIGLAKDCTELAFRAYTYMESNRQLLGRLGLIPPKNFLRNYRQSLSDFSKSREPNLFSVDELNEISTTILSTYFSL